ncbi:MAG TPA: hypothetical protein VHT91_48375 [Kofleriaceae bacterium]|nr:hypothetical protein [Kofleriaceae bacterium]
MFSSVSIDAEIVVDGLVATAPEPMHRVSQLDLRRLVGDEMIRPRRLDD